MRPQPTSPVSERRPALVSGEGVELELVQAGVASRTIAAVVDVVVQAVAVLALSLVNLAFTGADLAALRAVQVAELIVVLAGYPIVMEWTTRGRTVGKLWLGLRVVRDDGGPVGFRHALVRGLASLIIEKPGLLFPFGTVAGVVTMAASTRQKRIGDMMAGTLVLDERASPHALAMPHWWVPSGLVTWAQSMDMHRLDDTLALRLRQFVSRAHEMSPPAQLALGRQLLDRVLVVVSPPPPAGTPVPDILGTVLAERRRRTLAAAPAQTQAQAPAPAPALRPSPSPVPRVASAPDSPFARPE